MWEVIDAEVRSENAAVAGLGPHPLASLVERLERGSWPEGEYGAVVYDEKRHQLRLYKDPLGRQPLFLWTGRRAHACGTSLAAVASCLSGLRPDEFSIAAHLAYAPPDPRRTFFSGVRRLMPGVCTVVDLESGSVTEPARWVPRHVGARDPADTLRSLLERAVSDSVPSARRSGVALSGGFDSATLGALGKDIGVDTAVTSSFPGLAHDETDLARTAADFFGMRHVVRRAQPLPFDERVALARVSAVPDAVPGQLRPLRGAAEDGVEVLLNGSYGDELLGSVFLNRADLLASGRVLRLLRAPTLPGQPLADVVRAAYRDYYRALMPMALRRRRQRLTDEHLGPALRARRPLDFAAQSERWVPRGLPSHRLIQSMRTTYWSPSNDHKGVDVVPTPRISQPLGSPEIFSFALSMPDWEKGDATDPRRLHRATLGARLPPHLRSGPVVKAEFSPSLHEHLDASPISFAPDLLIAKWGWIDVESMRALEKRRVAAREAGVPDYAAWICSYAESLEIWARAWFQ